MYNLTQHNVTREQKEVVEPTPEDKKLIKKLLTFDEIPTQEELYNRASELASMLPSDQKEAMVGGAPFFMSYLEKALIKKGVTPYYAFSKREVIENDEGRKVSIFKHIGFVQARGLTC